MPDLSLAALAQLFDHTLLKPDATPSQIRTLCADAKTLGAAGVCVNPCYVSLAARELTGSTLAAMAVVGFPLGANRTDVKIDEALRAVGDGARELDMVINIGLYLGGEKAAVRHDVAAVVRAGGQIPTKVILETGYLNEDQIRELTTWCVELGAAFVKTSTGFGSRGASVRDIEIMAEPNAAKPGTIGVKASGGIKSLDSALALVAAGATRLGSSATASIVAELRARGGR
jgi:deoxyribose-phosphate aldolase